MIEPNTTPQEPIMAWHEQGRGKRPAFLFKLKLTANVKKAVGACSIHAGTTTLQMQVMALKINGLRKFQGWWMRQDEQHAEARSRMKFLQNRLPSAASVADRLR